MLVPEIMDDPAIDGESLRHALTGLARINLVSASAGILWPPIRDLAARQRVDRLKVLDLATGSGDVPLALWRRARRRGLTLEVHGVDKSGPAVEIARRRAQQRESPIVFSELDVACNPLPRDYDVVMSSLFLHHLDETTAEDLLKRMSIAAMHVVLVNDLRRHPLGVALAHVAGRVLTRSPVVRVDAVRSARAAFTIDEVRDLAKTAGLQGATVAKRWPYRFLLSWQR